MGTGCISYVAVVDDDESVCRSFGRLLRMAGYQPIAYPSAEAFLEDGKHPVFDCLLLDIRMTGMSGLELRRKLLEAGDDTPVVFITAQDDPGLCLDAETLGCAGFFRKTEPGALILDAIAKVIDGRCRDSELEPDHANGPGLPA